jgi:hypothetical protein
MSEERDTWPPHVGQRVWIKSTGEAADALELLPDGWVKVERYPLIGKVFLSDLVEMRLLDDLRPEYPHLVPEWQGTLD